MAITYLKQTRGTASDEKNYTVSVWFKRSKLGTDQYIYYNYYSGDYRGYCAIETGDTLYFYDKYNGTQQVEFRSARKLRDNNGWYNLLVQGDSTQSTSTDRFKVFLNGEQLTNAHGSPIYPALNNSLGYQYQSTTNNSCIGAISENGSSGANFFSGSMSHFYHIDGTTYAPTVFGEVDSDTGEWKLITSPSVTMGTNGYLVMEDGNTITDQSANSNNFTLGAGTLTNTEDCSDNVFNTWNPLDSTIVGTAATFANGNTTWTASGNSSSNNGVRGTLGASKGKYYFEAKATTAAYSSWGIFEDSDTTRWDSNGDIRAQSGFYGIESSGTKRVAGVQTSSVFTSLSNDDIVGFAFDLDNNKFWASVNGAWVASGDPSAGTDTLGTLASGTYLPAVCNSHWGTASSAQFNFGNGYFGTTAISSAGTNASNIGIFEYDVPTGYTALSTKGLQE